MDSSQDCKDRFHTIVDDQCLCDFGVPCDCCETFSEIPIISSIPSPENATISPVVSFSPEITALADEALCYDSCVDNYFQKPCPCGQVCNYSYTPGAATCKDTVTGVETLQLIGVCKPPSLYVGEKPKEYIQCDGGICCEKGTSFCVKCVGERCSYGCGSCQECKNGECQDLEQLITCEQACCDKSICQECKGGVCQSKCGSC